MSQLRNTPRALPLSLACTLTTSVQAPLHLQAVEAIDSERDVLQAELDSKAEEVANLTEELELGHQQADDANRSAHSQSTQAPDFESGNLLHMWLSAISHQHVRMRKEAVPVWLTTIVSQPVQV